MTSESGPAAASTDPDTAVDPSRPDPGAPGSSSRRGTGRRGSGLVLAAIALAWLAAMAQSVRVAIGSPSEGASAITSAAVALPGIVSASLVAGAALALAVGSLAAHRLADRPVVRSALGVVVGLVTGLAAAAGVVAGQSGEPAIMILGGTVAAAGVLGGALAGAGPTALVGAAVAGSLGVFLLGFVRELFKGELFAVFDADGTAESIENARGWFAITAAVAAGLLAGGIAYHYHRRAGRAAGPAGRAPLRWPAFLLAGAGAGVMLLLTEVVTRVGGAQVLAAARSISPSDQTFQELNDVSRINSALVVLFVGGLTAMIAYGRTLRPAGEDVPEPEGSEPGR